MSETEEPEINEPDPDDGSGVLDQRGVFRLLFNVPAIRNYVFLALGALAMLVLLLMEQGSNLGAILIAILGVCGVMLRFVASPVLVLLVVSYFMWTPTGIPGEGYSFTSLIEMRRFHFIDVVIVLSLLVYTIAQYRIYGLVHQAIAFEGRGQRKGEPHTRRPARLIRQNELAVMLGLSVALVIAGQLFWLLATNIEVTTGDEFPLRIAESRADILRNYSQSMQPHGLSGTPEDERFSRRGVLSKGASRFFVLLGMLFFGTLLATLVFRYWRLRTIGPDEGAMILLDSGWGESSRERVRLEKWRSWGRKRLEAAEATAVKKGKKS